MTTIDKVERDVAALINAALEGCPSDHKTRPWWADFPGYDPVWEQPVPTSIYFIKRSDGSVYATKTNRYLPGEVVLDTITGSTNPNWSIQKSPMVAAHIRKLQERVNNNGPRNNGA